MITRTMAVPHLLLSILCSSTFLFGQSKPAPPTPSSATEFPVFLEQSVAAGKTPVGTKIQAKLGVATLVNGTVVPKNAVFSGEVIESVAKTATDPSRLSVRMDSARWKNESAVVKLYVTSWYYPTRSEAGQDVQYGPQKPAIKTWNGAGAYPDPNSDTYTPFPKSDSNSGAAVPDTANSITSNHRVRMKDVESSSMNDTLTLVSRKTNLKLDKLTTYVLAGSDLLAPK
ncbi:MAG: hypothetical protein WA830_20860 [Candidatus Sulfotelmatobacter sp.]